ncbi:MAG: hypothetical protein JSW64_05350 [Candidatus Zixiibacteriota bacterium]|nr:MAG: hypothetical protein JSW64_05350 [candidate division Zixibacteria bacterium]
MDYLNDKKSKLKTPLKFNCPYCGNKVVSNYIQIGEMLNCPYCRETITVPEYAEVTSEAPNVSNVWSFEKPAPISIRKPTLADKIKKRLLKINIITGVIVAVGAYMLFDEVVASVIHKLLISVGIGAWVSYTISAFRKQE